MIKNRHIKIKVFYNIGNTKDLFLRKKYPFNFDIILNFLKERKFNMVFIIEKTGFTFCF